MTGQELRQFIFEDKNQETIQLARQIGGGRIADLLIELVDKITEVKD